LSGGTADLLEEGIFARHCLNGDGLTKARTLLLNEMLDITLILLDKRCSDLN
tara:strand:- start:432 stop:587 length:156 start_codon:yes stop_codon:yes gene_type:complete